MKKLYIVVILVIVFNSLSTLASPIQIIGKVKDSISRQGLPYCEILLKNSNDSLLTGSITDDNGAFLIKTNSFDTLYLNVRLYGYGIKIIPLISSDSISDISLDDIFISSVAKELKGIEITSLRPFVEKKFDRDIFNMNEGAVASARNIFDLLRKIPGITVDEENNVVKYKGNVASVKINNSPAERIYFKLEMIPINDIDKIEVIDPTMRGKGNGSAGAIINIKVKKVVLEGLSGSFSGRVSVGDTLKIDSQNLYANMNYKTKKFLYYYNVGTWGRNWVTRDKSWGNRDNQFASYIDSSNSEYNGRWAGLWNYAGFEYKLSEKSKFDIQIGVNTNYTNRNNSNTYNEIINANTNSIVDRYQENSINSLGVTYTTEIDTLGKELTIDFWGSAHSSNGITKNSIDNYYSQDIDEIINKKNNNLYTWFDVFYNHPVSDKTQWNIEYSGQIFFNNQYNDFIRNSINEYALYKDIKTKNFENSISAHYGTTFNKIKIDGGFSIQNKFVMGDRIIRMSSVEDTTVVTEKMFNRIEPVATIKYLISDKKELKLSYDSYSQMPYSINMFEPVIDSSNQKYWNIGNPNLKPAFNQSIYFGYTYTDEKWNTSIQTFVKSTKNDFAGVEIPIDSMTSLNKPMNLEENQSIGLFYSYYQTFGKAFTLSFNTNWFYSKVDLTKVKPYLLASGLLADNLIRSSWNYDISSNFEYRKSKNFASVYVYYNSKQISTMGFIMPKFDMNLSYSRTFLSNNLRFSVSFDNLLFGLYAPKSTTNVMGMNYNTESFNSRNRRTVSFSIRYNFREGDRNTASKSRKG